MKISIIIPVYNMADTLEPCVQSIISNNNNNFEIILVDDGSKDESWEVCHSLALRYDCIKAIHQENQGSGPARNTGINVADGDYLLFIDSDDILKPNALEKLERIASVDNKDLYVFGYELISKKGTVTTRAYQDRTLDGDTVRSDYTDYFSQTSKWGIQGAPWNKLFKTSVAKDFNVQYPALRRHQDEVFISRFVNFVDSVRFVPDELYSHYSNDMSLMWKKYPIDYMDIVNNLFQYRQDIIMAWNKQNTELSSLIYSEYINNVIRACFKVFSLSDIKGIKERKNWYKSCIFTKFHFEHHFFPCKRLGFKKTIQNYLFIFAYKLNCYSLIDYIVQQRIKSLNRV